MMKHCCFILLLCFLSGSLFAQNTDSLWAEFNNTALDSITRIRSLHRMSLYIMRSNPDSAMKLALREQAYAGQMGDSTWIAYAYNVQGGALTAKNDFAGAMDKFYRMLEIRKAMKDTIGAATAYNNIGNIYYHKGDYSKALEYYILSLQQEELKPTKSGLATSYINIGSVYALQDDDRHALDYFKRALALYTELEDENGIASCYANMGNIYKGLDSLELAKSTFLKAIELMILSKDDYGRSTVYTNLADVERLLGNKEGMFKAFEQSEKIRTALKDELGLAMLWINRGTAYTFFGQYGRAKQECEKGLKIAEKLETWQGMMDACECLYLAHKGLGQEDIALSYYEQMNNHKEKIANDETQMKLQVMEFRNLVKEDSLKREAEKESLARAHQRELRKGSRTRDVYLGIGVLLILLSAFLYRLFHKTRESKQAIEKEKSKADELLINILPTEIKEELMKSGKVEAQEFENVTILFTDIVGFTQVSERLPPQQLMDALNEIYSGFDEIMARYNIEKIKSIGDAYMAAGGLPVSNDITVKNTVLAALDLQEFMHRRKAERMKQGLSAFDIRVGIHTGPVVAGIIGVKKFQYDVWGDTVNTAQRMEANGEAGRVNISSATYAFLRHDPDLVFEPRLKVQVKGKGEMEMYFATRK